LVAECVIVFGYHVHRLAIRSVIGNKQAQRGFVDSRATLKPESHAKRSASPSSWLKGHSAGKPDVVFPIFMPASYAARRRGSVGTAS